MPFTPFPSTGQTKTKLDDKSLSLDAIHTDDFGNQHIELDIHNLNSVIQARATQNALNNLFFTKRAFISSDATFPSIGKYAVGHSISPNQAVGTDF